MIFTFCACKSVSLNSYLRWFVFNQKHNVLALTFHSRSMPPSWGRMVGGSDREGQKSSTTNWRGTDMIFITLKNRNFVSIWISPWVSTVVWTGVLRHCQPGVPLTGQGGRVVLNRSRKYPYPHQGWPLEIPREQAILILKFLRKKYKTKLEIPGGRGLKTK